MLDGIITVTCCITGGQLLRDEWVQRGGIEIPCIYNVQILKGKKDERKKTEKQLRSIEARRTMYMI